MKRILLTLISAFVLIGLSWSQTFNMHEGSNFEGMSSGGKWAYAFNQEAGYVQLLNIEKNELIDYQFDLLSPYVDDVSDNGYLAGSHKDSAAIMDTEGNWNYLPLPDDQPIISSSARGISSDASTICGYIDIGMAKGGRLPVLWEQQPNGEYTCQMLPYPEKDFSQLMPQASDALRVSDDGNIIAGRLIDWSGMRCLVLVWNKKENGEWEYRLLGENLIFNEGVELPFFDPDAKPELDPTDYFTEEDWATYYAAIEQYNQDVANDPENWWIYENPEYNQVKYITERLDEFNAAYAIFVELATKYNEAMAAYYEALDLYLTGSSIDVYYMDISPNGRYLSITIESPDEESTSWNPEPLYIPMYFDLETGESKIFDFEKGALAMTITNDGSLYYSTPYMSSMRTSYVIPAGVEDHSIELDTWISDKTDQAIKLSDYFYFNWTEFDWETYEDVEKEGVISGSVHVSSDGNIILGVFESPETFIPISYVVDLDLGTSIKENNVSSEINIYPNPVEDKLNISGEFIQYSLTNMNGSTVLKSNKNEVNVSHLPSGIYILKIESLKNDQIVKKILKR